MMIIRITLYDRLKVRVGFLLLGLRLGGGRVIPFVSCHCNNFRDYGYTAMSLNFGSQGLTELKGTVGRWRRHALY